MSRRRTEVGIKPAELGGFHWFDAMSKSWMILLFASILTGGCGTVQQDPADLGPVSQERAGELEPADPVQVRESIDDVLHAGMRLEEVLAALYDPDFDHAWGDADSTNMLFGSYWPTRMLRSMSRRRFQERWMNSRVGPRSRVAG